MTSQQWFLHLEGKIDALAKDVKQITKRLSILTIQGEIEMASIDDVIADIAAETTEIGNLEAFIQGLKDQLANAGIPQDKLDAAFAGIEANKARIVAAFQTNVAPPTV